jgi:GNAT superfamily N-acetyltransferase
VTVALERCVVRCVRPEERRGAVERVETWLDARGQLARTYPQVFGPAHSAELLGAFSDGELYAHAACREVRVRTERGSLRVLMVGSVVTAPEHRGRGLASELVRAAIERARCGGCDAVVLWSDRWAFYERLGFRPSGSQLEVELRSRPGAPPAAGVRHASFADLPSLHALHARKPCAAERTLGELAVLLTATPMATWVLERGGEVIAYACQGKGLDFTGWWHEVGGEDEDVAALVSTAMAASAQKRATLLLPDYRRGVVQALGTAVEAVREGVSGLCLALTERGRAPWFVDGLDSI